MKILAFDVGKHTGCALLSRNGTLSSLHFEFINHKQYYEKIKSIIEKTNPEVIVTSKPCRFYNTIYSHAQYISLIQLAADQIPVFTLFDREIKSWAFRGIKKVLKTDVMRKYSGSTEDEADARMFAKFAEANIVTEKEIDKDNK